MCVDSFHFAGMGDSRCPVTWGPMVYKYKYLVFKRLRYKQGQVSDIHYHLVQQLFQQASEADKCGH